MGSFRATANHRRPQSAVRSSEADCPTGPAPRAKVPHSPGADPRPINFAGACRHAKAQEKKATPRRHPNHRRLDRWQGDCSIFGRPDELRTPWRRSVGLTRGTPIINMMKVGTRLTLVLLLALTPVLVSYMYWSVRRSSIVYVHDLKRDIRATTRSLAPALENDLLRKEWNEVDDVLRRMTDDTTRVALLNQDGTLWKTSDKATAELVGQLLRTKPNDNGEFEVWIDETNWFCRVVPLKNREGNEGNTFAYLLVAQDWTDIRQDLKERTAISALAAFAVIGVIVALIPLLVRRYVSSPLAQLSKRVTRFSDDEQRDRHSPSNEVSLLTEEFRRLDDQLPVARRDVLAKGPHDPA